MKHMISGCKVQNEFAIIKLQEQRRVTCLFVLINMIHCKQHFGETTKNQIINVKIDIIWNVRIFESFRSYDV